MRALLRSPPPPPASPPSTTSRDTSHASKPTSTNNSAEETTTGKRTFAQAWESAAPVIQVKQEESTTGDTHAQVKCDDTVHTSVSSASSITSGNSHKSRNTNPMTSTSDRAHRLIPPSALSTTAVPPVEPAHGAARSVVLSSTTPSKSKAPENTSLTTPTTSLSTSPSTFTTDNSVNALDCISWLSTALSERGTSPHWVRECEACLVVREGFCTRESFAAVPKDRMNHAYLSAIGIAGLGMQQIILQLHRDMNA